MTLNGSLAGLVAITAGCDTVSPVSAAIIGILAGFVVTFGIEFIDQKLKIDDPVGAVGVHGLNGAMGTICVGLFSDGAGTDGKGLFTGGGFHLLGIQLLGVVSVIAWVAITMTIVFLAIKNTIGLRASREEEILGLDSTEHGLESSYADFMLVPDTVAGGFSGTVPALSPSSAPMDASVPVQVLSKDPSAVASDVKLSKVTIICNQTKFDALKNAMNTIGVNGITVTQVLGYGVQKGSNKYYRGVKMDVFLRPKVKVEVVVSKVPVNTVVEAARKALYSGNIGDGKIFVYDVENVIKVRTGEQGYDALQGDDES
jgi:Amt family ammonium transporter